MTGYSDDVQIIILEPEDFVIVDEGSEILDLSDLASRDYEEFEAEVIRLTNEERAAHDLHSLARNEQLCQSALAHTWDMAKNHFISHTSSDGCNLAQRVIKAEYHNWTVIGENVAMGHHIPEDVVRGWMNSPGHRKNILNKQFYEIGVAYIEGNIITPGGVQFRGGYWAQNFGTRLSVRQLAPLGVNWWRDTISSILYPQDSELDIVVLQE